MMIRVRSRSSRRMLPTKRSAIALARGACTECLDDVDVGGGEDGVECGGEFGVAVAVAVAVADQESEARAGAILRESSDDLPLPDGPTTTTSRRPGHAAGSASAAPAARPFP